MEKGCFADVTVLSLEQALTLPFLTYRLRQEGMNVIRIEHPSKPDPNRFIGRNVLGEEGMNSYFLQNNLGKKAITLNLKEKRGRELLGRLVRKLAPAVFATNQLPRSYESLGVDYPSLAAVKPDLIWAGITGFGPEISEPAYDPVLQAKSGLMELTGEPGSAPTVLGVPLADLGAAEHAFGQIMKALYVKAATGKGSRIDISMFDSCTAWLSGPVMFAKSFGTFLSRKGNTHEFFAPVSVFGTADGHVYLAVGNDAQWQRLAALPEFSSLAKKEYERNEGRIRDVHNLNAALQEILSTGSAARWIALFNSMDIPVSRVNTMRDLSAEPLLNRVMIRAEDPKTKVAVELPAAPVKTDYLRSRAFGLEFPPRLGEHNEEIYCGRLGLSSAELASLRGEGIV